MAPAQGWHAQIEKWSKFFWIFFFQNEFGILRLLRISPSFLLLKFFILFYSNIGIIIFRFVYLFIYLCIISLGNKFTTGIIIIYFSFFHFPFILLFSPFMEKINWDYYLGVLFLAFFPPLIFWENKNQHWDYYLYFAFYKIKIK